MISSDPQSSAVPLDYALTPSRWRKLIRQILLGLIVATMSFCALRYGPYVLHQSQLLYWQRQCMNFSLPPDTVVYEEEPTAAARLLKDSRYSPYSVKRQEYGEAHPTTIQAAAFVPHCWQAIFRLQSFWPWMIPNTSGWPEPIMFLHERISPAGHRRWICLDYYPAQSEPYFLGGFEWGVNCNPNVISPASWTQPPTIKMPSVAGSIFAGWPHHPLMRVYAGQPDPNDASHFTIRYQIWGQEDVLDGWLKDDDSVILTPRHPPQQPQN